MYRTQNKRYKKKFKIPGLGITEKRGSTYKRDLKKRIELIGWVLENMKNPDIKIWHHIESRMNETILTINKTCSIFEADKMHSELRILDWIFYQVCSNKVPVKSAKE